MAEEQLKNIKDIVAAQCTKMEELTAGTPYGSIKAVPDHDIFADIVKDCKDSEFWLNFKEISPVLLCFATETDPAVSRERDMCVTGEILKTKSLLDAIRKRLDESGADSLNMVDLAVAVKILADKVDVITCLKEPDSDPRELRFKLNGTSKKVKVDIKKLQKAFTFVDENADAAAEEAKQAPAVELTEEEDKYLADKLAGFTVEYAPRGGVIEKNCMMKLMKLIGDFSKMRSKDISKLAQEKRLGHYAKEYDQYVDVILDTMNKEEESFNYCITAILFK